MKIDPAAGQMLSFLVMHRLNELENENRNLKAQVAELKAKRSRRLIGFDR